MSTVEAAVAEDRVVDEAELLFDAAFGRDREPRGAAGGGRDLEAAPRLCTAVVCSDTEEIMRQLGGGPALRPQQTRSRGSCRRPGRRLLIGTRSDPIGPVPAVPGVGRTRSCPAADAGRFGQGCCDPAGTAAEHAASELKAPTNGHGPTVQCAGCVLGLVVPQRDASHLQ